MQDYEFWNQTLETLEDSNQVAIFLVAHHTGSSPGKAGFKMIITPNKQVGTVGGGIMEVNLINSCRDLFRDDKQDIPKIKLINQIHRASADENHRSGLICAGTQKIIRIFLDTQDRIWIKKVLEIFRKNQAAALRITSSDISLIDENVTRREFQENETNWNFSERVGLMDRVYLFGGGHVGYAISRVLSTLDFYLILHDNRKNLEMVKNNDYPDEKRLGDYQISAQEVDEGDNIYIIIATFGYEFDYTILKEVITKDVRYIGLMGSHAKLNKIFREIRSLGIDESLISKVHAPIGIDIPNETAEEIAISIAAELIKVKNQ